MIAPSATSSVFRQVRGLEVLTWAAFDRWPVDVLVTTRRGGVSAGPYASLNLSLNVGDDAAAVLENRRRAAAALGAGPEDAVFCEQVHGGVAEMVGASDRGRGTRASADAVPGADALVTADPGTVLAIMAADCVPVVLYDPVAHVLACAHAGWRGTVARAAAAAVAAMRSLGTRPADVIAGIGPAIAPDRYQVGAEVAEAAAGAFGDRAPTVLRATGPGQWQFDLWTANRLILTGGVSPTTKSTSATSQRAARSSATERSGPAAGSRPWPACGPCDPGRPDERPDGRRRERGRGPARPALPLRVLSDRSRHRPADLPVQRGRPAFRGTDHVSPREPHRPRKRHRSRELHQPRELYWPREAQRSHKDQRSHKLHRSR